MNPISRIWNSLFYHGGNGWWNLPRTPASRPNPQHEGPFGETVPKMNNWLTRVTYGGRHATPLFYVMVGIILAIITLIEVWIFGVESLGDWLVPIMLVLSLLKFVMVVAFFMHLRFDHKLFSWIFASCFVMGISVFVAVLVLQNFASQ